MTATESASGPTKESKEEYVKVEDNEPKDTHGSPISNQPFGEST